MKNFTVFPMSSYKSKVSGLIITAIAIVVLLVVSSRGQLPFLDNMNAGRQFNLFFAITVFGMYITACSKEKIDDDRVQAIRAKALQVAFMLLTGTLVSASIAFSLSTKQPAIDSTILCGLAAYGLAIYLILFHIGLYFDPKWLYNNDTVTVNIRKNKIFFLIYFTALAFIMASVFFIHYML